MVHGNQHGNNLTDEELLEELQRVADVIGDEPTANEFDDESNRSHTTYISRFGGWVDAKKEAGVHTGRTWSQSDVSKREYVDNIKEESSCKLCDEDFSETLIFHHRNPETKVAGVGNMYHATYDEYDLDDIKNEIEKCELICRNCHRKVHSDDHKLSI